MIRASSPEPELPADVPPEERRSAYLYDLPPERIAQHPEPHRDHARMMVISRTGPDRVHAVFHQLPAFLAPGDLLVLNDTRVIPARLFGRRQGGTAAIEVLLLRNLEANFWKAMVRPGRKVPRGRGILFGEDGSAVVIAHEPDGTRILRFDIRMPMEAFLAKHGITPLPPYIRRDGDAEEAFHRERYQTVYARVPGSAAAPTAGLHFTPDVLDALAARGVETARLTLHVGMGTFRPVETEDVKLHRMDAESFALGPQDAARIRSAREAGRRVIAVGTTATRALESLALRHDGAVVPDAGFTDLFIRPGFRFQVVGGLLTNFHLPGSTLLMLVSALAGRERVLEHYREAVRLGYRFFSYGDCMLVL
ncbi:MAG: tRNA preQ1(34) S-adenosylmethionine ribosyltransferase-isomerase QueA [Acidobacteria bacterium]|nr:tRNA preQ1(34) S-adenosylmethionine ribosyltransferase-isomerase QueA [Acidobacteriota bacterium]